VRKVCMLPLPSHARNDTSNSINSIVLRLEKTLPEFGYTLVEDLKDADLIAGHAGQQHRDVQPDVAHLHGLYPSAYPNLIEPWMVNANQGVVNNFMGARAVTAPSQWVADLLRRDCHIDPAVIPWAIDFDEWQGGSNQGYVLWNKTRSDPVCDPVPIVELAKRVPELYFMSTFGFNPTPNLKIIGRQTFEKMRSLIQGASIGVCTTKETFCIGALEFMAAGIPVLGYAHGNVPNLVKHGINGYIVAPGDIDGLIEGLAYCLKHREQLGSNAREIARLFSWDKVAGAIAHVYDGLFMQEPRPKVAVVIPHHNYSKYVGLALQSVLRQETSFEFEAIVVDDGSQPGELANLRELIPDLDGKVRLIEQSNTGVALARNAGINASKAEYICCLDADDQLGDPKFLQTLADALDADRGLGIVFTGLQMINENGEPGQPGTWPNGFDWEAQISGRNQIPTACLFRREAWRRAGGYKSQYQPAEDAELWTRIVSIGFRAKHCVDSPWFYYRVHDGSLSDNIRRGKRSEPDWRTDKPWVNDKMYPLAANGQARPVRNYDRPKVSVIVPVAAYHVSYLSQALDSIERQTERYWECIAVNDTGEPLPGLAPFPWARVVDTDGGQGAGVARNLGVKHATAPFVTFLDADDMLLPRFLEVVLKKYQQTGRYIYTDWLSINKAGMMEPHQTPEFVTGDVFMKPVQHAVNILIKRQWFEESGGFDETMVSWEDVDWFMRLAKIGICGARVPEPLFIYRYLTGQRREKGEQLKSQIISTFNEKYGEYISGAKMCGCTNQPAGKQMVIQGVNGQAPKPDQLVRVIYNGPPGQHSIMVGKQSYGYRKGGDTLYVRLQDLQAQPDRFTPIAEVLEEKQSTPVPPPPPVVVRQAVTAL